MRPRVVGRQLYNYFYACFLINYQKHQEASFRPPEPICKIAFQQINRFMSLISLGFCYFRHIPTSGQVR